MRMNSHPIWKNVRFKICTYESSNEKCILTHIYIKTGRLTTKTSIMQLWSTYFHTLVGFCIFQIFYNEHVLLQSDFVMTQLSLQDLLLTTVLAANSCVCSFLLFKRFWPLCTMKSRVKKNKHTRVTDPSLHLWTMISDLLKYAIFN